MLILLGTLIGVTLSFLFFGCGYIIGFDDGQSHEIRNREDETEGGD